MMTTQQTEGARPGRWVTPAVSYVDPLRLSCALCGRPIARRHWREEIDGDERIFCEPAHAELYETYWLEVYGSSRQSMKGQPGS
jgi:hypothetical protein